MDPGLETALHVIRGFEGCRLNSYQDAGGVWTVGYGCTGPDICQGVEWTTERAEKELEARVVQYQERVKHYVKVPLTANQEAALISLTYNIGTGAFARSSLLRVLNEGNYTAAASCFETWNHVHGQVNTVLSNRRVTEKGLFLST